MRHIVIGVLGVHTKLTRMTLLTAMEDSLNAHHGTPQLLHVVSAAPSTRDGKSVGKLSNRDGKMLKIIRQGWQKRGSHQSGMVKRGKSSHRDGKNRETVKINGDDIQFSLSQLFYVASRVSALPFEISKYLLCLYISMAQSILTIEWAKNVQFFKVHFSILQDCK